MQTDVHRPVSTVVRIVDPPNSAAELATRPALLRRETASIREAKNQNFEQNGQKI
jgi:hypothetical protein